MLTLGPSVPLRRARSAAVGALAALALSACAAGTAATSAPSALPSEQPSASTASPAVAAPLYVLALGESITGGGYLPEAERTPWPVLLEQLLPAGSTVANVARGGTGLVMTSPDGTASTIDALPQDLAEHPETTVVLVAAGRNDLHNRTDAELQAGYQRVADLTGQAGAQAWFATILPVSATYRFRAITEDQRVRINVWLRATYPDRLIDLDVVLDPARTGLLPASDDFGDGFHPNVAGHQAIARAVADALQDTRSPA